MWIGAWPKIMNKVSTTSLHYGWKQISYWPLQSKQKMQATLMLCPELPLLRSPNSKDQNTAIWLPQLLPLGTSERIWFGLWGRGRRFSFPWSSNLLFPCSSKEEMQSIVGGDDARVIHKSEKEKWKGKGDLGRPLSFSQATYIEMFSYRKCANSVENVIYDNCTYIAQIFVANFNQTLGFRINEFCSL